MEAQWVDRLERRLGFLAAPGLPGFVAGMTAMVGLLRLAKGEDFSDKLALVPQFVLRGELWRVLTFLFVPPPTGPLWLILWIALVFACLRALESAWGEFKFTVFVLLGLLATAAGSLALGVPFGNDYIILSSFLAFARLMPEREVLVLFVLPVKLRWLAALAGLWIALELATARLSGRVELASGLVPYALFFGPGHWRELERGWRRWRGGGR